MVCSSRSSLPRFGTGLSSNNNGKMSVSMIHVKYLVISLFLKTGVIPFFYPVTVLVNLTLTWLHLPVLLGQKQHPHRNTPLKETVTVTYGKNTTADQQVRNTVIIWISCFS